MDTSDTSWSRRVEDWQRLQWARQRAGVTQAEMAKAVGIGRTAYLKYETDPGPDSTRHTDIKLPYARTWAKKLKVSWLWLAVGHPYTPFDVEPSEEAVALGREVDKLPDERRKTTVSAIRALIGRTGTEG